MTLITRARAAGMLAISVLMLSAPGALADVPSYLPDAQIRRGSDLSYTGEGVFNLDASGQSVTKGGVVGNTLTFWIKIRNLGALTDSFKVKRSAGYNNGYRVRYYNAAGTDVTGKVNVGSFTTPSLLNGQEYVMRATVKVRSLATEGSFTSRLITVSSVNLPAAKDAVRFTGELAAVFARAFSNIDGIAGFDSADVLVAELVDANGSGVLDAGDRVRTVEYPIDNTATAFLPYGVTIHTVTAVATAMAGRVEVNTASALFVWSSDGREMFVDGLTADDNAFSVVVDGWGGGAFINFCDSVFMNASSASQPAPLQFNECGAGEGDWFDVVISPGS